AGLSHGASGVEVFEGNNLSLDEALFKVGVNHTGGLRGSRALADGPGAGLLWASGQVGLQAEGLETSSRQGLKTRFGLPNRFEKLQCFVFVELKQLGFGLRVEEDCIGRRN